MESSTKILRRMLDERGVEHSDFASAYRLSTRWQDSGKRVIEHQLRKDADIGDMGIVRNLTPEQAIAATLGSEESYTRDDVESAFVSGYSLGCLPVGSDPQWDQNEQTVDEHMAELGWVRAATVGAGTCKVESSYSIEFNTLISTNYFEFEMSCGSRFSWGDNEPPDHCPGCGRKVVHDGS